MQKPSANEEGRTQCAFCDKAAAHRSWANGKTLEEGQARVSLPGRRDFERRMTISTSRPNVVRNCSSFSTG